MHCVRQSGFVDVQQSGFVESEKTDLSPSLAVSGFWLFPVSPNLRPVLGTNGPAQGAYLGKDSSNGSSREMAQTSTIQRRIEYP